ncbi:hypothetical protein UYSO10_1345 [Kosakonia radicincitans]|nr:hypothetical protein UYSO10_1345 [Kosakonia radicincitans]
MGVPRLTQAAIIHVILQTASLLTNVVDSEFSPGLLYLRA